jgi:hypothetical protein
VKLLRLEDGDTPVLLDSFREEGIVKVPAQSSAHLTFQNLFVFILCTGEWWIEA